MAPDRQGKFIALGTYSDSLLPSLHVWGFGAFKKEAQLLGFNGQNGEHRAVLFGFHPLGPEIEGFSLTASLCRPFLPKGRQGIRPPASCKVHVAISPEETSKGTVESLEEPRADQGALDPQAPAESWGTCFCLMRRWKELKSSHSTLQETFLFLFIQEILPLYMYLAYDSYTELNNVPQSPCPPHAWEHGLIRNGVFAKWDHKLDLLLFSH